MKIATFNINSINKRFEIVQNWIVSNNIDIIALQELKSQKEFCFEGYECSISNQKQFNGVATCSVLPIISFKELEKARAIYTKIEDLNIINIYAPLGDLYLEKFEYKINFYNNLINFISNFNLQKEKVILLGDFNIIHKEIDVFDAKKWEGHITFLPEEREIMNKLLSLGLFDSFRELYPNTQKFSFFDYRDKFFKRGLRLDYILVSKPLLKKINDVYFDFSLRTLPSPSDHIPVIMDFDDR